MKQQKQNNKSVLLFLLFNNSIILGGFIYAVNGMTSRNIQIKGFTIDPINRNVTEIWGPESSVSCCFIFTTHIKIVTNIFIINILMYF